MYVYNDGANGTNRVIIVAMLNKDDILCIHKKKMQDKKKIKNKK